MVDNDFHFKKSSYDRPTAAKVCGLAKEGRACDLGPGPDGHCPGRAQCHPLKNGDRWECSRSQHSGGKCVGPSPEGICPHVVNCVPDDTARYARKKWIALVVLIFLAVLLLILSTPLKYQFLSPGELSAKHGGIGNNQCADCHRDSIHQPLLALPELLSEHSLNDGNQRCLSCHSLGVKANLPHSVSSQELQLLSSSINTDKSVLSPSQELSCVSCHTEHKGVDGKLTAVNPQQCDSCHQRKSDPFEKAHPEFSDYGHGNKKLVISFDHKKHFAKHFNSQGVKNYSPQQCVDCHQSNQQSMNVMSFDSSCGACHSKDVSSEKLQQPGVALFSLPTLDIDSLSNNGIYIGDWPSDVDDGELSPFSMMALAENTGIENLITRVRQGQIDLSDLSNESLQDLALVGELAWELKNWLYQLQTKGHSQLSGVIEKNLGANAKAERHADMIAGLPQIITDNVQRQWFAALESELSQYQQGFTTQTNTSSSRAMIPKVGNMSGGGWYVDGYAIRYRPSGHNDEFMRQWIESTSVAAKNSSAAETVRTALVDDDAPGQCVKCHAVGSSVGEMPQWASEQSIQIKSFTRFDHQAHLILKQEEGCVDCHQTATETDFQAIKKQQCIGCHTEPLAGNDCLTCHNYHIDNLSSLTSSSSLPGFSSEP